MVNESLNYIRETIILIKYYSFDLGKYNIREVIVKWTKIYPHDWIPLGVIEAIYQGRLKGVSVEQILNVWLKKGCVNQSFSYEFSRLIKPNNINFAVQDQELEEIFIINSYEKKEEKLNVNHDFNYDKSAHVFSEKESILNEFQPLEDYSKCFQKLKNFISES